MAAKTESKAGDIVARRGIYFRSFGVYEGMAGFYDYGPVGVRIKRNIENAWRNFFVNRFGALEIETSTVLPEIVLRASGHLATFTDPITTCEKCKTPYRADKALEEHYKKKGEEGMAAGVGGLSAEELGRRIEKEGMRCARCGARLGKVEKFNLMLRTRVGSVGGETAYLRPETAQGVYIDFKDLAKVHGVSLPVGVAQIGKSYRNEISPRQHLVRMREFSQMELQVFFDPGSELEELGGVKMDKKILDTKIQFLASDSEKAAGKTIAELMKEGRVPNTAFAAMLYFARTFAAGLGLEKDYRFREIGEFERAHYAKAAFDLEVNTSYGYTEIAGTHYRADYDLSSHGKMSGKDVAVTMPDGRKVVPHVLESAWGVDRLVFAALDNAVVVDRERGWDWLRLSERIAPYRYAVFPLQKDGKLVAKAREIYKSLLDADVACYYSETASIGKRYARADEIGVPRCITIDYTTLEDGTVTVRDRDTTKQVRKQIGGI